MSILSIALEMPIVDNFTHPSNAFLQILFTEAGMVMVSRLSQPEKVCSSISSMEFGRFTVCSCLQPLNAPAPMLVTESGMVMVSRLLQPEKVCSSISLMELGRATVCSCLQPLKAPAPMLVTESGMVTERRFSHPSKASSAIVVTVSGITKLDESSCGNSSSAGLADSPSF